MARAVSLCGLAWGGSAWKASDALPLPAPVNSLSSYTPSCRAGRALATLAEHRRQGRLTMRSVADREDISEDITGVSGSFSEDEEQRIARVDGIGLDTEGEGIRDDSARRLPSSAAEGGVSPAKRLGILATLSVDEGSSMNEFKLPMADMIGRMVKSDVVLLLDIVGTLLLCACFALDTLPLRELEKDLVHALEIDTTFYFTILYVARWYTKGLKLSFLVRPLSLVDLVSLMPLFLGDSLRSAAFLRVLRILKIARLLQEEELSQLLALVTGHHVDIKDYQLTLVQAAFTLFSVIFVTAGVIYELETTAGLDTFSSFFDAMYFSITTLTTVGYGDVVPQSAGGKAFVSVAILLYTVLIPYELGLLANSLGLMNKRQERMDTSDKGQNSQMGTLPVLRCKACGASEHQVDAVFCRKCGKALQ